VKIELIAVSRLDGAEVTKTVKLDVDTEAPGSLAEYEMLFQCLIQTVSKMAHETK
jgi:hypothetical protein